MVEQKINLSGRPPTLPGFLGFQRIGTSKLIERPLEAYTKAGQDIPSHVLNEFLKTSNLNPRRDLVDKLLKTGKRYGQFDVREVLYLYQVPIDQLHLIKPIVETWLATDQIILRAAAAIDRYKLVIDTINQHLQSGKSIEQLFKDERLGPYLQNVHGLPVIKFNLDGVTIFSGVGGLYLPIERLVTHISDMNIGVWSQYYKMDGWNRDNYRTLSAFIAKSKVPPLIAPGVRTPYGIPLDQLRILVLNLPEMLKSMGLTIDQVKNKPPQDEISEGARQMLIRYVEKHPEIIADVKLPEGIPYFIDDYIPASSFRLVPEEIKRTSRFVKVVDNPYSLIPDFQLFNIAVNIRNLDVEFEESMAALIEDDKQDPSWAESVLNYKRASQFQNYGEAYYYMAARGIKFPTFNIRLADQLTKVYDIVIGVKDSGGLGNTEKEALPTKPGFLNDALAGLKQFQINLIAETLSIPDPELIDEHTLRTIIRRGYINPLPLTENILRRHNIWKLLTPLQKQMLNRYYGKVVTVDFFVTQVPNPQSSETYILAYTPQRVNEIITALQMKVPPGVTPEDYVTSSLHLYDEVLAPGKSKDTPNQLTDLQILYKLNALIGYKTRQGLIDEATYLLGGGTGFFFPFERKCLNDKTVDFSGQTSDVKITLIAYGKLNVYHCYQITELFSGFAGYGEGAEVYKYQLPDPEHPAKFISITKAEAHKLRDLIEPLLAILPDKYDVKIGQDLLLRIQKMDDIFEKGSKYDEKQYAIFTKLPMEARPLIRKYLQQIFELGMYARRWKGPPNPYPVAEKDTLIEGCTFIPEIATATPLNRIYQTEKELEKVSKVALEFVHNLHTVNHLRGTIIQTQTPLKDAFYRQYQLLSHDDRVCIRIGSSIMIGTGDYYIKLFFKSNIPDYDPTKLEAAA